MKKIVSVICAAVLALTVTCALCACNGDKPQEPDPLFAAENWQYMTVNGGKGNDSGGKPYTLSDGSIKFHNANSAYDCGKDLSNSSLSFMLNGSLNWQMWFLANTADNTNVNCYKLVYKDGVLFFTTSEAKSLLPLASAKASDTKYKENDWNEFEIAFETADDVCTVKLTVNDSRVTFTSNDALPQAGVTDGNFTHTQSESFATGNYICVKVWYGDCYLRLKPVGSTSPGPIKVACLGDSITYGANADNSYTDSYPAQLQQRLGGDYNVMNFGKSGATVRDGADDPYRRTQEYNGAKLFVPDIAVIMLGTNDSKTYQKPTKSGIYNAFDTLYNELLTINSGMEIWIATSPYAYSSAYQISNANIESTVVPAQEEFALAYGLRLIPMHEYTKDMNGNYADGIHPTSKGYTYISYRMYCELTGEEPDPEYVKSFKDAD